MQAHEPEARQDESRIDRDVCGRSSLLLATQYLNMEVDPVALARMLPSSQAPFSLAELQSAAKELGCRTRIVHWHDVEAAEFGTPGILHVKASDASIAADHFVTCFGATDTGLCIGDFPAPPSVVSRSALKKRWSGDVLYVETHDGRWIGTVGRSTALHRLLSGSLIGTAAVLCYVVYRAIRRSGSRL